MKIFLAGEEGRVETSPAGETDSASGGEEGAGEHPEEHHGLGQPGERDQGEDQPPLPSTPGSAKVTANSHEKKTVFGFRRSG